MNQIIYHVSKVGFGLMIFICFNSSGQIDTVTTVTNNLNITSIQERVRTYAVFLKDSSGALMGSADIWQRKITIEHGRYYFYWQWFRGDSLFANIIASGNAMSFKPYSHHGNYKQLGKFSVVFNDNVVTIPDSSRRTQADSAFRVNLTNPAFEFPLDLEIIPLLPLKKTGQRFAIPFYEPGTKTSSYYLATFQSKEIIRISGKATVRTFKIRLDYGEGAYASFWVAEDSLEVLKVEEFYAGKFRYKVLLY